MGYPDANVEHPQGQMQSPLSCTLATVSDATNLEELRSFINQPNLVVLKFSARWCGPCKFMAQRYASIANQYADHSVQSINIDIDKVVGCDRVYGVRSVPTFLLYRGGVRVGEVIGSNDILLREVIVRNL